MTPGYDRPLLRAKSWARLSQKVTGFPATSLLHCIQHLLAARGHKGLKLAGLLWL
jgi:hypothetical protein